MRSSARSGLRRLRWSRRLQGQERGVGVEEEVKEEIVEVKGKAVKVEVE